MTLEVVIGTVRMVERVVESRIRRLPCSPGGQDWPVRMYLLFGEYMIFVSAWLLSISFRSAIGALNILVSHTTY